MRINYNGAAMNAHRHMGIQQKNISGHVEKLSSGMRINKAGDDAAGLAISEKMRAQIKGLNMASRNAQDGISLIQTAEGALGEIHSLLQRGRELSVQASNDTYIDSDIKNLQIEIDQIKEEINRITETTEFNEIKLLNRPRSLFDESLLSDEQRIIFGMKSGWLEESAKIISEYYGLDASTRNVPVILEMDAVGGVLAYVSSGWSVLGDSATLAELKLTADLADFPPATGENGENALTQGGSTMYNDRIILHEMVHALMADSMGDDDYDLPKWFKEGTSEFIHGADERLKNDAQSAGDIGDIVDIAIDLINGTRNWGVTANEESWEYAAGYLAIKYIEANLDAGSTFKDIMATIDDDVDNNNNLWTAIEAHTSINETDFQGGNIATTRTAMINYYGTLDIQAVGEKELDTGSIQGIDHMGSTALNAEDVVPTGTYNPNPTNFNFIFPVDEGYEDINKEYLRLQIGANESQSIHIALSGVSTRDLRLDDVDLSENPQAAITSFENAIELVSEERSFLGAMQNRLEYTINNLDNTAENLLAAESRIRDVDMAKEMMAYSKSQILLQVSQMMMAQANQQNNSVLALLN